VRPTRDRETFDVRTLKRILGSTVIRAAGLSASACKRTGSCSPTERMLLGLFDYEVTALLTLFANVFTIIASYSQSTQRAHAFRQ